MTNRLRQMLIRHEGLRRKPYRDTVGKLTIGAGRNLDDVGITREEALASSAAAPADVDGGGQRARDEHHEPRSLAAALQLPVRAPGGGGSRPPRSCRLSSPLPSGGAVPGNRDPRPHAHPGRADPHAQRRPPTADLTPALDRSRLMHRCAARPGQAQKGLRALAKASCGWQGGGDCEASEVSLVDHHSAFGRRCSTAWRMNLAAASCGSDPPLRHCATI